jgi:hypothetical protein
MSTAAIDHELNSDFKDSFPVETAARLSPDRLLKFQSYYPAGLSSRKF